MGGISSALGGLTGSMGGAGPTYRGYRVKKGDINEASRFAQSDLRSLYGDEPYDQPGLGYSPETMQSMDALSEGDVTAERQNLFDQYGGSAYGTRGREYLSAEAGRERSVRGERQRGALSLAVANEMQKRQDLGTRMNAARGYRSELVGDFNDYATNRYGSDMSRFKNKKQRWSAAGEFIGGVADAYTGGML